MLLNGTNFFDDLLKNKINIDAIIMAGGKGNRLSPFHLCFAKTFTTS